MDLNNVIGGKTVAEKAEEKLRKYQGNLYGGGGYQGIQLPMDQVSENKSGVNLYAKPQEKSHMGNNKW